MRIVKTFSYGDGLETIQKERLKEFSDVMEAVKDLDPDKCLEETNTKLYSPKKMTSGILESLQSRGWTTPKAALDRPDSIIEGDGVKNGLGVELQFSRYSFLGWDSLRKMSVFAKEGTYKYGIEVAPMASLRRRMSKGVGSYEQMTGRLQKSGNFELSIPAIILGMDV